MKRMLKVLWAVAVAAVMTWADWETGAGTPPNVIPGHVFQAPQNPGSALIIFNDRGYDHPSSAIAEYSKGAMETFRAALAQDINLIQHPSRTGWPHSQLTNADIPTINPPLTRVNILNVTSNSGIEAQLEAKFRGKGSTNIDDFSFEGDIFDELYNAGNPLSYWSQVYDLRYANISGNAAAPHNISTDLNDPRSDISYYGEHLRSGGSLFLMGEYDYYENRNNGISAIIRNFTQSKQYSGSVANQPSITSFTFRNDYEHFATDFNDLNALFQQGHGMTWVNAGGVTEADVAPGFPLVIAGGRVAIAAWGEGQMDPSVGNGRLLVCWDTNAWSDYMDGRISKTTFALIQNMYDLMDGSKQYRGIKEFVPAAVEIDDIGVCRITVRNDGNYLVENIVVTDDLSSCLQFTENTGAIPLSKPAPTGRGGTLEWTIPELLPRSSRVIEFRYRAVDMPPCN